MDWLEEMNKLADRLKELEERLASLYKEKFELEREISLWESKTMSEISQEINEKTGKPKFTSDTTRKAEVERRKAEDKIFQRLQSNLEDVLDRISETKININHTVERLKNIRVYLRYQSIRNDDTEAGRNPLRKAIINGTAVY